jgi:hypothetical protein
VNWRSKSARLGSAACPPATWLASHATTVRILLARPIALGSFFGDCILHAFPSGLNEYETIFPA